MQTAPSIIPLGCGKPPGMITSLTSFHTNGHLGCFQFGAIMNRAVMVIPAHVFWRLMSHGRAFALFCDLDLGDNWCGQL